MDYRYTLKPYRKPSDRLICPGCGKRGEFAPYIDRATGEVLSPSVGRCNREHSCGYHMKPKEYFERVGWQDRPAYTPAPEPVRPVEYLPLELLERSAANFRRSTFYDFMQRAFTPIVADQLFKIYCVGASRYWRGAVLFPQIDFKGNFRHAKIMLYNPDTGRRVKAGAAVERYNGFTGQYERITAEQDCAKVYGKYLTPETTGLNLVQVPFGLHLLAEYPTRTVCIVESEKTAMVAAACLPAFCWIATGGANGARWKDRTCTKYLEGRKVILFPDLGQYEKWSVAAEQIRAEVKCEIHVNDLLEKTASGLERDCGYDLADYLLRQRDETSGLVMTDVGYPVAFDFLQIGQ